MKIILDGEPKEMAALVMQLQRQPRSTTVQFHMPEKIRVSDLGKESFAKRLLLH